MLIWDRAPGNFTYVSQLTNEGVVIFTFYEVNLVTEAASDLQAWYWTITKHKLQSFPTWHQRDNKKELSVLLKTVGANIMCNSSGSNLEAFPWRNADLIETIHNVRRRFLFLFITRAKLTVRLVTWPEWGLIGPLICLTQQMWFCFDLAFGHFRDWSSSLLGSCYCSNCTFCIFNYNYHHFSWYHHLKNKK